MDKNPPEISVSIAQVDHIPVLWCEPAQRTPESTLVIWLPGLSMNKEDLIPRLQAFAEANFIALSFDPWQHGERSSETGPEIIERVFGDFRKQMWPILGQTTLDTLRIIDWAITHFEVRPEIYMGGLSMGGDIAVAAAGIDHRIKRVASLVATPDWLRPGMRVIHDPAIVLPPGTPDAYAQYFYDTLNPLTHLEHYAHGPYISFECAANDTHVPPDGAQRFKTAYAQTYPDLADHIRVNLIPDAGHMDGNREEFWHNVFEWFTAQPE